jgi:pyrroloquinoline quinone biosynthesis protein B
MRVHVLGSAAGGGFPQWNCNCRNCAGLRRGSIRATARTQSSIAVSADGERWYLANASPDIRQQIESFAQLHPRRDARDTPIEAIMLTNADVDHVAGLLSLRESQPLLIYATETVRGWVIGSNAIFRVLSVAPKQSRWEKIELNKARPLIGLNGKAAGILFEAFAVPGKPPTYLGLQHGPDEATIGLRFVDERSGRSVAYVPGIKQIDSRLAQILRGCDCILFDGTCWSDDELIAQGAGTKTALAMGHLPIGGPGGSLNNMAKVQVETQRRIYIHINNTNPILDEDSAQRREVEAAGWEIAFDGMDFEV